MSPHTASGLIRLKAAYQGYDWGRQGSTSLAGRLASNAIGHGFEIEESKTYAEIWMGTHTNGPAHLFDDPSKSLLSLISSNPSLYLGDTLLKKWPSTTQLPYLFKILSCRKALPLQAHPDKGLAEQLQLKDPSTFVDANHKPEIAIAIGEPLCVTAAKSGRSGKDNDAALDVGDPDTAFLGFVGFRPLEEIANFVLNVPELLKAIGDVEIVTEFVQGPTADSLKRVVGALLRRGVDAREFLATLLSELVARIKMSRGSLGFRNSEDIARLLLKVHAQYPGDAGVFVTVFFMNLAKLKKGQVLYVGADEIHAWLEGDLIECMAASDNVVNAAFDSPAALAPQIDTFVDMLTYTARPVTHWDLPSTSYPHALLKHTVMYDPPMEEFIVLGTFLKEKTAEDEQLSSGEGPMIGIVTKGKVKLRVTGEDAEKSLDLDEGGVVFIAPGNEANIHLREGGGPAGNGEIWWSLYRA